MATQSHRRIISRQAPLSFQDYKKRHTVKQPQNLTIDDDRSLDSIMYVFDHFEEINQKNKNLRINKVCLFIKIKFRRILRVIRERLKNQKIIYELTQFANTIVSKYTKEDRSFYDTSGY